MYNNKKMRKYKTSFFVWISLLISFLLFNEYISNASAFKFILREKKTIIETETRSKKNTIILSKKDDPYYKLAEEIALNENITIVSSINEAIAQEPNYLLWIASPTHLDDRALVGFSLKMKERNLGISVGIISGSTLENARELWLRAAKVKTGRFITANAANPTTPIESNITIHDKGKKLIKSFTKDNMLQALKNGNYLTFTGHGGSNYLILNENTWISSDDIPHLSSIVITTGSCNTFRLWNKNSIALTFINKGAAAYAGFVYSPNGGYLIGAYKGLPFRYTWHEFPIGHVMIVQNRGTIQGFAQFPFYYLLGDPRIAFKTKEPYNLIKDDTKENSRILSYTNVPEGIIPMIIRGGAQYSFVKIPGITSAWDHELFYNSKLQMVNIHDDKYILFAHKGGDCSLQLYLQSPWYWIIKDVILDSLDHNLIYFTQTGGQIISIFIGGFVFLIVIWFLRKRKPLTKTLMLSSLIALGFVSLQCLYALLRQDNVTITSKTVSFNPISLIGTFLFLASGAFMYFKVKSKIAKGVAIIFATFPTFASSFILLGACIAANYFFFKPKIGAELYNYSLFFLSMITFIIECILFIFIFSLLKRQKIITI